MRNVKRRSLGTILALIVGGIAIIPSIGGATTENCYVIVSHYNDASISFIDPVTYTVETNIATAAGQPFGLSVSPDGETLYVAQRFGDHVEIFDVVAKASTGTIPIGTTTNDVIVSPNGGIAAAVKTDWGASTIEIIDLTTNAVTGSIPIPVDATVAEFSPDGSQIWVNSVDSGTVGVVDIATLTASSFDITHSNPGAPYTGIADIRFSPAGDFAYVGNAADDRISVVDTSTLAEITTIGVTDEPGAMAFSPDGTKALVVIPGAAASIEFIDTSTHTVSSILDTVALGYDLPDSAVFSPDNSQIIFTGYDGDEKIVFLDLDTMTVAGGAVVVTGGGQIADVVCRNLEVPTPTPTPTTYVFSEPLNKWIDWADCEVDDDGDGVVNCNDYFPSDSGLSERPEDAPGYTG